MMDAKARLLARTMSSLSEEYFCASWLIGCEYALWVDLKGEVLGEERGWGISAEEREDLQLAHNVAGGWVIWSDEARGQVFLSDKEWLEHLDRRNTEKRSYSDGLLSSE